MNSWKRAILPCSVIWFSTVISAQQPQSVSSPAPAEKPRVFVTDSESWESHGAAGGSDQAFAGSSAGGARPQTAEIVKTFGERCTDVVVNNKKGLADYIVVLDHEGGKSALSHHNKIAVFERLS
jgi:hypothetical protein